MKKTKKYMKCTCLLLSSILLLSGCAGKNSSQKETESGDFSETDIAAQTFEGLAFDFQAEPETFELSLEADGKSVIVSEGGEKREISDYQENGTAISWRYPEEKIAVTIKPEADYLSVAVTSETEEDNSFIWPEISGETYYLPLGEGKRVPADDPDWQEYLGGQEFYVPEQLSMPFWVMDSGDYSVLFIMEDPYRNNLRFSEDSNISFSVFHEYPEIDENRINRYRIYLTDKGPVGAAKLYRSFCMEKGDFMTLEQKAESNPDIRKLYGAPFVYLWGEFIVSPENINWNAFRKAPDSPLTDYLAEFADSQENGAEFTAALEEIKGQDYVAEYQKNVICSYLSQLLKRDDFRNPSVFTKNSSLQKELLSKGYENLTASEKIQLNKEALAVNWPEIFSGAEFFMDASTVDLIREMKESGIERAWIGLNSWEQAYAKPELVDTAAGQGYLIGSYDSYHSIHEPGKEQWITAKFEDVSLYEKATVADRNGKKISGFQNVGRKLNPVLSMPAVKERMEDIMSNGLPFNSWFIDCDATGEIYDDYTEGHLTTRQEDLAARLERIAYIRDRYRLVIGSEGGHDFAASTIAFAHGIELKSFSWMDEDMKKNRESEFYIGKYYNPGGGVAEHFSKRIPVKERYDKIFVNPAFDVPLFKLVYNDSVITGYHWDWSTFKIKGATADRMVREVLYNVPPLYHLDAEEWERYREDIVSHHSVWSVFSEAAVRQEMTDFTYLTENGEVQKTVYGDKLAAVANFGDTYYQYGKISIPGHSVWIQNDGEGFIYSPAPAPENS